MKNNCSKTTKLISMVFVVCFIAILIIPLCFTPVIPTTHLSGSTELVEFPSLVDENNNYNDQFITQMGKYFEDHFAFRTQLVTANALLRNKIFHDSGTKQVISGDNGYYFYAETMNDYLGKDNLSDNDLTCIARNLKIVQDYLTNKGKSFCFTIAPNKNSLYSQFMPYYYIPSETEHNAARLKTLLKKYGVNYLDLFEVFDNPDNQKYLKEDSHWNNRGALIAANELLGRFKKEKVKPLSWESRNDRDGDLYAMVYPDIIGKESEEYAKGYNDELGSKGSMWEFKKGEAVDDNVVYTQANDSDASSQDLYMYRDSFANALIPYLSSSYKNAIYSKLIPYDIDAALVNKTNNVIIERAERHLPYLAENAPIMSAPLLEGIDASQIINKDNSMGSSCNAEYDGDYLCIKGSLSEDLSSYIKEKSFSNVVVQVKSKYIDKTWNLQAFVLSSESIDNLDFCVRILKKDMPFSVLNINVFGELNGYVNYLTEYNVTVK